MKKLRYITNLMLCILVMSSLFAVVCADGGGTIDPLDKLNAALNSKDTQDMAWGIVMPFAKFIGVVLYVLAVVALLFAIGDILLNTIKAHRGKGKVGKDTILRVCVTLFIALLLFGGGWVSYAKAGKTIIVDPSTQMLDPTKLTTTDTTTTQTNTQSSTQTNQGNKK